MGMGPILWPTYTANLMAYLHGQSYGHGANLMAYLPPTDLVEWSIAFCTLGHRHGGTSVWNMGRPPTISNRVHTRSPVSPQVPKQ